MQIIRRITQTTDVVVPVTTEGNKHFCPSVTYSLVTVVYTWQAGCPWLQAVLLLWSWSSSGGSSP